ncbi:hypothetical protein QJQ45_016759 [Haematococcus lacustris]|nr:hypothetical protein QJQ45_016759 [Haematococcus lacustris]
MLMPPCMTSHRYFMGEISIAERLTTGATLANVVRVLRTPALRIPTWLLGQARVPPSYDALSAHFFARTTGLPTLRVVLLALYDAHCRSQECNYSKSRDFDQGSSRRNLLLGGAVLPLLSFSAPETAQAAAEVAAGTVYDDPEERFSVLVPDGWESGLGEISNSRRTVVFYPRGVPPAEVNVSVVITNVSVEFTRLGSFGNVATFAGNLVNSLDRSFLLRQRQTPSPDQPIQVAKLVDYNETRGQYLVEYTVQKLPEPARHLYSAVALGNNGSETDNGIHTVVTFGLTPHLTPCLTHTSLRYNRLYTLTAQCGEEQVAQWGPLLRQIVASFKPDVPPTA